MSRLRRQASALEDFLPLVTQKFRVGFGKFSGQTNGLVLKRNEVLFEHHLRKVAFQPSAQNNAQLLIEGNESAIKCRIVKG